MSAAYLLRATEKEKAWASERVRIDERTIVVGANHGAGFLGELALARLLRWKGVPCQWLNEEEESFGHTDFIVGRRRIGVSTTVCHELPSKEAKIFVRENAALSVVDEHCFALCHGDIILLAGVLSARSFCAIAKHYPSGVGRGEHPCFGVRAKDLDPLGPWLERMAWLAA